MILSEVYPILQKIKNELKLMFLNPIVVTLLL